jgi:trigger factor
MESRFENLSASAKRVVVDIPYDEYKDKLAKIVQEINKRVSVKGFRKGKAPAKIILRDYAPEIQDKILNDTVLPAIVELAGLKNVKVLSGYKNIQTEYGLGKPLQFSAEIDVVPEVTLPDMSSITVERAAPLPGKIEESVQEAFRKYVELNSAEIKQAPEGYELKVMDRVTLTHKVFVAGNEQKPIRSEGPVLQVISDGEGGPGFYQFLVGRKVGDVVELAHDVPETDSDKRMAGKRVIQRFTILGAGEFVRLPIETHLEDLGDSEVKTPEDLRRAIRRKAEENMLEETEGQVQSMIIREILRKTDVPVPKSYLERAFRACLQEKSGSPPRDVSFIHDAEKMARPEYRKMRLILQLALREAQRKFILAQVAQDQHIEVGDDDIRRFVRGAARFSEDPDAEAAQVEKTLADVKADQQQHELLLDKLLQRKVFDWLEENVNIVQLTEEETLRRLSPDGLLDSERPQEAGGGEGGGHGHSHSHGEGHEHSHRHGEGHQHSHEHGEGHEHSRGHSHEHGEGHEHSHEHSRGEGHEHSHEHSHGEGHEHSHEHSHGEGHEHSHKHSHAEGHEHSHGEGQEHSHGEGQDRPGAPDGAPPSGPDAKPED